MIRVKDRKGDFDNAIEQRGTEKAAKRMPGARL